jgi:hypothetical protein
LWQFKLFVQKQSAACLHIVCVPLLAGHGAASLESAVNMSGQGWLLAGKPVIYKRSTGQEKGQGMTLFVLWFQCRVEAQAMPPPSTEAVKPPDGSSVAHL